jgi:hypothetical protein
LEGWNLPNWEPEVNLLMNFKKKYSKQIKDLKNKEEYVMQKYQVIMAEDAEKQKKIVD